VSTELISFLEALEKHQLISSFRLSESISCSFRIQVPILFLAVRLPLAPRGHTQVLFKKWPLPSSSQPWQVNLPHALNLSLPLLLSAGEYSAFKGLM